MRPVYMSPFTLALLSAFTLSGDGVRVFLLQPDIWQAPRDDVYLRFNMTNQQVASALTDLTICSRVYLTALTTLQILLSYATADNFANAIMMYVVGGKHFFRFNNKPQEVMERLEVATVLRQWRHYCNVLSGNTYTVYVDGVAMATGPLHVDDRVLPLNGTFVIGQEQDGLSSRFNRLQILKGRVAQINIWNYGLLKSEIEAMAACRSNILGNVLSSDREDFEQINTSNYNESLPEFCMNNDDIIVFPEPRLFSESIRFCERVGSFMYTPLNQNESMELNKTLHREDLCQGQWLWVGATDEEEEGVWRTLKGEILKDIFFTPGQPDNTRLENCLYMDRESGQWSDLSCLNYKACVACDMSSNTPLYLRGLCMEWETEILVEFQGYKNMKPYFHGYYGLMIYRVREKEWILFNTVNNETQATLTLASLNLYPIGRHSWTLLLPLCDRSVGSQVELSLSTCQKGEYMCNDGQCIDITSRCDAKDDCRDETDEDNCSILKVPNGYRAFRPPKNIQDPTQPLQPYVNFHFLRFLKIEDVQQAIHLEFIISIEWPDTRLKYLNLRPDIHANKLSKQEAKAIWRPELEFPNVKDGELKLIKENLFVSRVNGALPFDFNAVEMDTFYGGVSARLIQEQHYSGSFVCNFDVSYYPFDVQQCSVLVQLSSLSKQLVEFSTERSNTRYGQASKQSNYVIGGFYSVGDESNYTTRSLLEVGYTLTRRSTRIVLAIYLPSLMLLVIGYSTLYVSVNMLQVRLTVSLTTLLVLYTFFNQTSSSLPNTAYVKMIDVWFFSCTILLFFIILIHVVVECLEKDSDSVVRGGSVIRVGQMGEKKMSRVVRLSAQRVLRLVRLVVVPMVVMVFVSVYWVLLLDPQTKPRENSSRNT